MQNARHERLRKEKANHDVEIQSTIKYNQECKSTKKYKIPPALVEEYLKCPDKDLFLLQYSECEVIE